MFNTVMSRLNNQQTGSIVLVMQRLHVADLAGELLELGGWKELRLAALATEMKRSRRMTAVFTSAELARSCILPISHLKRLTP